MSRELLQALDALAHAERNPALQAKIRAHLAHLAQPQAEPVDRLTATAPREIWLQVSDEPRDAEDGFPADIEGITWCATSVLSEEVRYVREDLAHPAAPVPAVPDQRVSTTYNMPPVALNYAQAVQLMAMYADDAECEITLSRGDGHSGPGVYAWYSEYPEEGGQLLDPDEKVAPHMPAAPAPVPVPVPPGYVLVPVEPHDDMLIAGQEAWAVIKPRRNAIEDCKEADAVYRAMIAAAPPPVALTPRELELIDGMIEVQFYHASQCDGIANRKMADKQKGWDMERVELLRKLAHGIAPGAKE